MFNTLNRQFEHNSINVSLTLRNQSSNMKMAKSESIASYFMRITELRDKLRTSGGHIEDKELVMTTLNGLPPSWESFIQTISGRTKWPKFDSLWENCTQEETRIAARQRVRGTQPEENQEFMGHAKKLKGKGRTITTISIKVGDQALIHIKRKRRRIYHIYNASGARNIVTMQTNVHVQAKGNLKPQQLM